MAYHKDIIQSFHLTVDYHFFKEEVTYEEARIKCLDKGYLLAMAKTSEDQRYLQSAIVESREYDDQKRIWFGMTDIESEGLNILWFVFKIRPMTR